MANSGFKELLFTNFIVRTYGTPYAKLTGSTYTFKNGDGAVDKFDYEKIVYRDDGTLTILWADGTETKVVMHENEAAPDLEKALAMAIAKRALGSYSAFDEMKSKVIHGKTTKRKRNKKTRTE